MAGRLGIGQVVVSEAGGKTRVMKRQSSSADVDRKSFSPAADPLGSVFYAIGEHRSESLASGDLLGQGHDGVAVAPCQVDPVRVPELTRPFSKHSMANAIAPPTAIVSIP